MVRERRLLSVLRWILRSVPTDNRWYPVFSRYVDLVGDRVVGSVATRALSNRRRMARVLSWQRVGLCPYTTRSNWNYEADHGTHLRLLRRFQGFLLSDCRRETEFGAREHRIEALARIAWRERITRW